MEFHQAALSKITIISIYLNFVMDQSIKKLQFTWIIGSFLAVVTNSVTRQNVITRILYTFHLLILQEVWSLSQAT